MNIQDPQDPQAQPSHHRLYKPLSHPTTQTLRKLISLDLSTQLTPSILPSTLVHHRLTPSSSPTIIHQLTISSSSSSPIPSFPIRLRFFSSFFLYSQLLLILIIRSHLHRINFTHIHHLNPSTTILDTLYWFLPI
ncbi:hypothetical protein KEM48_006176, partial [Puccinia striiformis f. sp. tritici PST-130]